MQPENRSAYNAIEEDFRAQDPLETVVPGYDDEQLAKATREDIGRIDSILDTDTSLTAVERRQLNDMGMNLRLDWLYAESGGRSLPMQQFVGETKHAETFIKKAAAEAYEVHDKHPQDFWQTQVKLLDLRAFAAHRYAADSQTTLKGTPNGQKLFGFSQDIMKSVISDSIRLMKDLDKFAHGSTETAQDARGSLYELMILTYARMKHYEDQDFDKAFVRSALSREDRPWNKHAYPKRAFDIAIEREGEEPILLQAKNHNSDKEYAQPIRKVQDTQFGRTMDNLPKFIMDFSLLLDNPTDPLMKAPLIKAERRLDEVFGTQIGKENLVA
jgi:hypothetical protein